MNARITELLRWLSQILHWLGHYAEANTLTDVAVILSEHNINTTDELKKALEP